MTTPWLDIPALKLRSTMPTEDIDLLNTRYAGFVAAQLATIQAWIESRLRKRYAVPFAAPVPEIALNWLAAIVTLAMYQRRGWQSTGAENEIIIKAADDARAEIKEAADSQAGLFDLPLREDAPTTSGIVFGGPLGYSEQSPYRWADLQRLDAIAEDASNGR
jgi:hypothetical protein